MKNGLSLALASVPLACVLLAAQPARAGIDACGNIHVEANAECKVQGGVECTAQCEPIRFEAACAGELYVDCSSSTCRAEASATCQGTCDITGCTAECEAEPGRFDCKAECTANAQADCSGRCAAEANKSECEASCKATASGECDSACEVEPATASCQAKCEAVCKGECRTEANVDCQINCQSDGFLNCESRLEGGCEGQCTSEKGALFCDGQYVDHGGNLEDCIRALRAELNITVSGHAECANNQCVAEGEASCECGVPGVRGSAAGGSALGVAGLAFVGAALRRRRRR